MNPLWQDINVANMGIEVFTGGYFGHSREYILMLLLLLFAIQATNTDPLSKTSTIKLTRASNKDLFESKESKLKIHSIQKIVGMKYDDRLTITGVIEQDKYYEFHLNNDRFLSLQ